MKLVRIVGTGMTKVGRLGKPAEQLAIEALQVALRDAEMTQSDLQGIVAVPSLSNPQFMQGHYIATVAKLLPGKMVVRTVDTGGAGPISALSTASALIRSEWCETVAVVASDSVLSLSSAEFAARASNSVAGTDLASPPIPHGYDRVAQYSMKKYGITREQLAMVSVLMSWQAQRHPDALCRRAHTLDQVLQSPQVAPVTSLLECARRADGGAAFILSSSRHYKRHFKKDLSKCPVVIATGEASGPLYPPPVHEITEEMFSCERACSFAYTAAQVGPRDIGFFGLYDCFPICFLRALEATRICSPGEAGSFIEEKHRELLKGTLTPSRFPFNTHGGLLAFAAPWETPAAYNVIEAVAQLNGAAAERQVHPKPTRALVYGNGGIFSASAVAILGDGRYD